MAGSSGRLVFNVTVGLLAVPVGRAVKKAADKTWSAFRPDAPPTDPRRVDTRTSDALIFAGMTGVTAALTSLVATRGADTLWRMVTGTPPPPPEEPKTKKGKKRRKKSEPN